MTDFANKYRLLPQDRYTKVVRRPYPPLLMSYIAFGEGNPEYFDHFIKGWSPLRYFISTGDFDIYQEKENTHAIGEYMFDFWQDPKNFEESVKRFEAHEKVLLDSVHTTYENFVTQYERYMPALQVLATQDIIRDRIEEKLLEKTSKEESAHILDLLNIPLKDNVYKVEIQELMKTDDIEAHVNKYRFIGGRYGSREGYTVEQALEKKAGFDTAKFEHESVEEKEKVRRNIDRAKELLGDKALWADIMQWVVFYRTQRTDVLNRSSFEAYQLFLDKAQSLKLSYEELLMCMRDEVSSGNIPGKDILAKRKEGYSLIDKDMDTRIYTGEENQEITKYFAFDLGNVQEIKGQIACRGVGRGRVKVIFSKTDLKDLERGDVLVTSMTTPDMVAAMDKAVAFVTDEGGITCHAAIMSRELKKPCVIGTKIATQALKDGDFVEVDAEKGVVRKI